MMGTLIELLAMVGFMAGVVLGELRDQAEARREAADAIEAADDAAYWARIRAAFGTDPLTQERAA